MRDIRTIACFKKTTVEAAVKAYGQECYDVGLEAGLAVAEKIILWLSREPDNAWQKEVREWAEKELASAKKKT